MDKIITPTNIATYKQNSYDIDLVVKFINSNNDKVKIEKIKVDKYKYILNTQCWINADNKYYITPQTILNEPDDYRRIYEKIKNADLFYPIIIVKDVDNSVLLDGHHRIVKALKYNIDTVDAYIINLDDIQKCKTTLK